LEILSRLMGLFSTEQLARHLWIVEEDRVRVRS